MKLKSIFVTAVALFSLSAHAGILDLFEKGEISSHSVYERMTTDAVYHQTEALSRTKIAVQVSSPLMTTPSEPTLEEQEDRKVPGIDNPGLSNAKLIKGTDGFIYLETDVQVDTEKDGMHINYAAKNRIQLAIIYGTWDDYLNGKTIELKATEDGSKAYLADFAEAIKGAFRAVADIFKQGSMGEDVTLSEPTFSKLAFAQAPNSRIHHVLVKATLKRLDVNVATVKFEMHIGFDAKDLEKQVEIEDIHSPL